MNDGSQATQGTTEKKLTDPQAETLEKKGLWRRAARRWLEVMDNTHHEKLREAAALRRNHCQRMANCKSVSQFY